ncbi:hypothetical protein ACROYT_G043095 [Oculina patagonica]
MSSLYQSSEVNAAGTKKKVKPIGCFRERNEHRAIPSVEDSGDRIILDPFRKREDAVEKCALVAMRLGYKTFGVRRQGLCATGPRAHETYSIHGRSSRCSDGKGAKWANSVYTVSGRCRRRTGDDHCCVFPFTYQGENYNSCTTINSKRRPWCAITPNFPRDREWGYCKPQTTNISTAQVPPSLPQQSARSIQ